MILSPRTVKLTTRSGTEISRTLPHRQLRTIGAWCFVDHFGPTTQEDAMSVAAHPHVGLQTVSWLFEGEVEHRDSLGSVQVIKPGQLNLMTAGYGVAHSELSTPNAKMMHGVQLWTVLPDGARNSEARFDHYQGLPTSEFDGITVRLFIGEFLGMVSPALTFSPLLGAEVKVSPGSSQSISLRPEFEYGLLLVAGDLEVNSEELPLKNLFYIPAGEKSMRISSTSGATFVLLGGEPFKEEIIMWWNFIGRTHEEIMKMRADWNDQSTRFPYFEDQIHGRIPAPELPNLRLSPRANPGASLT
jgi:redox-sensitive bicupin YhaK (pirin superfamily)